MACSAPCSCSFYSCKCGWLFERVPWLMPFVCVFCFRDRTFRTVMSQCSPFQLDKDTDEVPDVFQPEED